MSTVRIQELEASRLSDTVVQQLKEESELKGRISQTNRIHYQQLVTYNVLADSIEDEFKMETKLDAYDVGSYLTEFFTFLIGTYPNEFIHNIEQARKETLLVNNNFFVGYIALANKMYTNKVKAREIRNILKGIDFSRGNETWKTLEILDEKGNISDTPKARKAIKQYFAQIKIDGDNDE